METQGASDLLSFPDGFRANLKFTPTQICKLVENTRFPAENLEKVLRLLELLIEFHKDTILTGKLVLKDGTALNLFCLSRRASCGSSCGRVVDDACGDRVLTLMIGLAAGTRIRIGAGGADLRRWFVGLSGVVQTALAENPFSGQVFTFRGKIGDLIQVL